MGEVEADLSSGTFYIHSHIVLYGECAEDSLARLVREEIEFMWNEPAAFLFYKGRHFATRFTITSEAVKDLDQLTVISNTNPRYNFFRVENFIHGNISFVDGLGCNTGYFLLENLYKGSTTAAHEYGHTLGLNHPKIMDIRGQGVPGIMYPRGTLVDPEFQYDPSKPAGVTGGTMHPAKRKVKQEDIEALKIERLSFIDGRAILGGFTNVYHWKHVQGG